MFRFPTWDWSGVSTWKTSSGESWSQQFQPKLQGRWTGGVSMTKSLSSGWFWRPSSLVRNMNLKVLYFCLYTVFLLVLILYVTSLSPPFLCLSFPSILLFLSSPPLCIWQVIDWFNWKSCIQFMKYKKRFWKFAVHYIISKATLTLLFLMFCVLKMLLDETQWLAQSQIKTLKSWWLNGFIWLVTGMVEENNDKKMLMKRKELKLTVKPNWNYLHFLQLHDILFTCFCTVHMFLHRSILQTHTHTLNSIWMVACFCTVIFLHWVWTAFDWQLIFVLFLYFCTVHIFLQRSILHTHTEQHLIGCIFAYCCIFTLSSMNCFRIAFDWQVIFVLLYFYTLNCIWFWNITSKENLCVSFSYILWMVHIQGNLTTAHIALKLLLLLFGAKFHLCQPYMGHIRATVIQQNWVTHVFRTWPSYKPHNYLYLVYSW